MKDGTGHKSTSVPESERGVGCTPDMNQRRAIWPYFFQILHVWSQSKWNAHASVGELPSIIRDVLRGL